MAVNNASGVDDNSDPGYETGGDSQTLNLTGSTGKNDASSPWGGILGAVNSLGTTAGSVYSAVNGKKPATKASTTPAWLIPAAIGGVLLLVVLMVVRK